MSQGFWRRQFGSNPAIVGQAITVNGEAVTVVGVLPASFDFGSVFSPGMNVDIFVPAIMDFWRTWGNTLALVGRLKPGVTVAQAQAEANILSPQLKAAHPESGGAAYRGVNSPLRSHSHAMPGRYRCL